MCPPQQVPLRVAPGLVGGPGERLGRDGLPGALGKPGMSDAGGKDARREEHCAEAPGRGPERGSQSEASHRAGGLRLARVPELFREEGGEGWRGPGFCKGCDGCGVVTRVPFQGQLPIGLLELLLAGVAPHPQRFVVTLHRPAGQGAGAGARGGAGARARAEGVAAALLVLFGSGSPAPTPGQPASAAAAAAARGGGSARRRQAARAAARGRAEGAVPEAAASHGLGGGLGSGKSCAGGRRGLGGWEAGPRRDEGGAPTGGRRGHGGRHCEGHSSRSV